MITNYKSQNNKGEVDNIFNSYPDYYYHYPKNV